MTDCKTNLTEKIRNYHYDKRNIIKFHVEKILVISTLSKLYQRSQGYRHSLKVIMDHHCRLNVTDNCKLTLGKKLGIKNYQGPALLGILSSTSSTQRVASDCCL